MARTTPRVRGAVLNWHNGVEAHTLTVETADWYAWLEQASLFAFEGPDGSFTARKERKRQGGMYWRAYRKRAGKLHRAYLGRSSEVTLERLQAVARALAGESSPNGGGSRRDGREVVANILSTALMQTAQMAQTKQTIKIPALPASLTSFVGRKQDIACASMQLRQPEVRLLTLIGPGGVGKTRLAIEIAERLRDDFGDGVFFVPLASISDPTFVLPAIAQVLELRAYEQSAGGEVVQRYLQNKQLLLVLDNLEHLIGAALQVEQLLLACPQLKLLVTSRISLHIQGEQEFPTLPLQLPELTALPVAEELARYAAIDLFGQRAKAVLPTFQLTEENARAVATICVRLDGLPLAIELAAARIKLLPPQALLKRLSHRLQVLTGGWRTLPERLLTLRGAFQWSYDLLSSDEQWLFRLLCVFAGGCTLESVEAVCLLRGNETMDVLNTLASLVDHSLVQQSTIMGETSRIVMLETIHEYGRERLAEQGEREESLRAHALWCLRLVEEIAPPRRGGGQQPVWLEQLNAEQENLRAALDFLIERKEAELALRLSSALWWYWITCGSFSEGRAFLEAALALPSPNSQSRARAAALSAAGELAFRQGNYSIARGLEEEGIAIYRRLNDKRGLAEALRNLALVSMYQHDFATARPLIEQSIALCRELGDAQMLGHAMDSQARLLWKQGDIQATRTLCEKALQVQAVSGEVRAQISPRKLLASLALIEGDYVRAALLSQELLTIAETINDQESQFHALFTLGEIAKSQGDDVQALRCYQQSQVAAQNVANQRNRSMILSRLGELAFRRGDASQAVAFYGESLRLAGQFEDTAIVGWSLLGLARVARSRKDYWRAAILSSAGEVRLNLALDLDFVERVEHEREVAALRTYLGEERYLQARGEGQKMTPEQAIGATEPVPTLQSSRRVLYPDNLTAREVEILRLVALGWTDAQVAEKLVISPRTVQGHLRSIYNKIDVTSRSAATRYLVEHNLA